MEFLPYNAEEQNSCCQNLQDCCLPSFSLVCAESLSKCFCCSPCCTTMSDSARKDQKKEQFARIQYRPMIDSNILTGNTLLRTARGSYYFPQTHHTLWPEHGDHYRQIKASPVISEQPFGGEKVRRSARILAALKGRRRAPTTSTKCKQQFFYDPTSPLPSLAQSSIEQPDQPTLTFAAIHDIQTSMLTIFLKFASNLNHLFENPQKQILHSFVTLHILPSKNEILQTCARAAHESNNNPVFNQQFVFDGVPVSELAEQTLVFRVYNGRALIGISNIPLSSIDLLGFTICKRICKISECPDIEVSV